MALLGAEQTTILLVVMISIFLQQTSEISPQIGHFSTSVLLSSHLY